MLSKKTQYAFKALIYLSEHADEGPVLISEISKKKNNHWQWLGPVLAVAVIATVLASRKTHMNYINLKRDEITSLKININ